MARSHFPYVEGSRESGQSPPPRATRTSADHFYRLIRKRSVLEKNFDQQNCSVFPCLADGGSILSVFKPKLRICTGKKKRTLLFKTIINLVSLYATQTWIPYEDSLSNVRHSISWQSRYQIIRLPAEHQDRQDQVIS